MRNNFDYNISNIANERRWVDIYGIGVAIYYVITGREILDNYKMPLIPSQYRGEIFVNVPDYYTQISTKLNLLDTLPYEYSRLKPLLEVMINSKSYQQAETYSNIIERLFPVYSNFSPVSQQTLMFDISRRKVSKRKTSKRKTSRRKTSSRTRKH